MKNVYPSMPRFPNLEPEDLDLIRRDRELPALGLVLDGERLAALIRARLDGCPVEAQPNYIRYKPGVNCLAAYTFRIGGRELPGYAKAFRAGHVKQADPKDTRRLAFPLLGLNIFFFPEDARLKQVSKLFENTGPLEKVGDQKNFYDGQRVEVLKYHPEKRVILKLTGRREAVRKFYAHGLFEKVQHNYLAFAALQAPFLTLPRHFCPERAQMDFDWRPGDSLANDFRNQSVETAALEEAGVWLGKLHGLPVHGLPLRTWTAEQMAWLRSAEILESILPHARQTVLKKMSLLIDAINSRMDPGLLPLHGDFHSGQVIRNRLSLSFLDLDRSAAGPGMLDLANFVTHLERDVISGWVDPDTVQGAKAGLVHGYESVRGKVDLVLLDLVTAGLLLKRITKPFRLRMAGWPEKMERTLERAGQLVRTAAVRTFPG